MLGQREARVVVRHRREDRLVEIETGMRRRIDGKIALDDLGAGIQPHQTRRHFAGIRRLNECGRGLARICRIVVMGQPPAA